MVSVIHGQHNKATTPRTTYEVLNSFHEVPRNTTDNVLCVQKIYK